MRMTGLQDNEGGCNGNPSLGEDDRLQKCVMIARLRGTLGETIVFSAFHACLGED